MCANPQLGQRRELANSAIEETKFTQLKNKLSQNRVAQAKSKLG